MVDAVLDVGHGRRPDGRYDPGTIAADGTREHDQAHVVTGVAREGLRRSGVDYDSDDHGTAAFHDPNYAGSVQRINRLDPRAAVEVHFDWSGAPRGGFGIHYPYSGGDGPGRQLAARIADAYRDRGLRLRYDGTYADTRGLAFVRQTDAPAVIWECDRVGSASVDELHAYGECIAEGICAFLGVDYVPLGGGDEPTVERITRAVVVTADREPDRTSARYIGRRWGFAYVEQSEEGWWEPRIAQHVDVEYAVAVGHDALRIVGHVGDGLVVAGADRHETEEHVAALLFGDPPARRRPWS